MFVPCRARRDKKSLKPWPLGVTRAVLEVVSSLPLSLAARATGRHQTRVTRKSMRWGHGRF